MNMILTYCNEKGHKLLISDDNKKNPKWRKLNRVLGQSPNNNCDNQAVHVLAI